MPFISQLIVTIHKLPFYFVDIPKGLNHVKVCVGRKFCTIIFISQLMVKDYLDAVSK